MPTELKPCPFCGGKAVLHKGRGVGVWHVAYVRCSGCGIRTQEWRGEDSDVIYAPIDEWNRREGEQTNDQI